MIKRCTFIGIQSFQKSDEWREDLHLFIKEFNNLLLNKQQYAITAKYDQNTKQMTLLQQPFALMTNYTNHDILHKQNKTL